MNDHIKSSSISKQDAVVQIKQSHIGFRKTSSTAGILPNPVDLFLFVYGSCILKSVPRFSTMMKFTYSKASIEVKAQQLENPTRMGNIDFNSVIYSHHKNLNSVLLKNNIKKFGTSYNTVKLCCAISGAITTNENV